MVTSLGDVEGEGVGGGGRDRHGELPGGGGAGSSVLRALRGRL